MSRGAALAIAAAALTVLTGCGQRPRTTGGSETAAGADTGARAVALKGSPAARAQALIDSGNRAYEAGHYGVAARRYAAAAVVRRDDPAAYYGLGMALAKLGRDEDARTAYARARVLAQGQAP